MSLIGDIRTGLKNNIQTIDGLQVSRYFLVNPTPPGVHILPPGIVYHKAFQGGVTDFTFIVQAFVALNVDMKPQIALDDLLAETGSRSLVAALESDKTLGGVADDVFCQEVAPARPILTGQNTGLMVSDLTVIVSAGT